MIGGDLYEIARNKKPSDDTISQIHSTAKTQKCHSRVGGNPFPSDNPQYFLGSYWFQGEKTIIYMIHSLCNNNQRKRRVYHDKIPYHRLNGQNRML